MHIRASVLNSHTISSLLIKYKKKLHSDVLSNVIYKFRCRGCDSCYITSAQQKYKTCIGTTPSISSPRKDTADHGHTFNKTNFPIINSPEKKTFPIIETIHIYTQEPPQYYTVIAER